MQRLTEPRTAKKRATKTVGWGRAAAIKGRRQRTARALAMVGMCSVVDVATDGAGNQDGGNGDGGESGNGRRW